MQACGRAGNGYMRRVNKLWNWLRPGGVQEVPGLRRKVLHRELSCKHLATISTNHLLKLTQQAPAIPVKQPAVTQQATVQQGNQDGQQAAAQHEMTKQEPRQMEPTRSAAAEADPAHRAEGVEAVRPETIRRP